MSSTALRFHGFTFAFFHLRRDRQIDAFARHLRVRTSRRHVKRLLRSVIQRLNS